MFDQMFDLWDACRQAAIDELDYEDTWFEEPQELVAERMAYEASQVVRREAA